LDGKHIPPAGFSLKIEYHTYGANGESYLENRRDTSAIAINRGNRREISAMRRNKALVGLSLTSIIDS